MTLSHIPAPDRSFAPALRHRRSSAAALGAAAKWRRAVRAYEEAQAESARIEARVHELEALVDAAVPLPEILQQPKGGRWSASQVEQDPQLPLARKAEMLTALVDWEPRRRGAEDALGYTAAVEVWDDDCGVCDTFRELVDTPAPDGAACLYKLRAILKEANCDWAYQDVDTADTISQLLGDDTFDGAWPKARLYQDLLRLVGARADLAAAEPFAPEEWAAAFEALPGHRIGPWGPEYQYPDAWPAGRAADEEVTVTDADHLARWARDLFKRTGQPAPVYPYGLELGDGCIDRLDAVYEGLPDEAERLRRALLSRQSGPVGRDLWTALPQWRRTLVIRWAAARDRRLP